MTTSLGFRTDLMLLALQSSITEARDGYLVVRTPANPVHHWGNYLLLSRPPEAGTVADWRRVFKGEFPDATHLALGVDSTDGAAGDENELGHNHLHLERSVVLTAGRVRPPAHGSRHTHLRVLECDSDWEAALALREANNVGFEPSIYHEYATRRMTAMRRLQREGYGAWFGAFVGDTMASGLGVFSDGSGVARFQDVDTHLGYRRQGLAGSLIRLAGEYARTRLNAHTLVMVADPDYVAIRLYRSLGFTDAEIQVHLSGE